MLRKVGVSCHRQLQEQATGIGANVYVRILDHTSSCRTRGFAHGVLGTGAGADTQKAHSVFGRCHF